MENIPTELKYTATHEWVRDDGNNIFTVGLTEPAQSLLGKMVNVELPSENVSLNAGEECASIESMKTTNEIFMPLSGEIIAINDELEIEPELVNTDPYGDGWLIQIKINDRNEIDDLLDANSYFEIIEELDEDDYEFEEEDERED